MLPRDSFQFQHRGLSFRAYIEEDDDLTPPWEKSDGHGVVTDWIRRGVAHTGWVLCDDRGGRGGYYGHRRYYDIDASRTKAEREGWGVAKEDLLGLALKLGREPTPADALEEAVQRDFDFLQGWATGQWCYVGVCVVMLTDDGHEIGDRYAAALWGIDSCSEDYIRREVAPDLANEALSNARSLAEKVLAALAKVEA